MHNSQFHHLADKGNGENASFKMKCYDLQEIKVDLTMEVKSFISSTQSSSKLFACSLLI